MNEVIDKIISEIHRAHIKALAVWKMRLENKMPIKQKNIRIQNGKSFVAFIFIAIAVWVFYTQYFRPPSDFPIGQLVTIQSGLPLEKIAQSLEEQKVVQNAKVLSVFIRLRGDSQKIYAGDYLFANKQNLLSVARIITTGAFGLEPVRITIPEGSTVQDMANIYEKKMLRFNAEKFINLAFPYEGFLFPDTYFFLPNATEESIINTMRDNFAKKTEGFEEEIKKQGKTMRDIVIMASIVEKEASIYNDRRIIAGVLWERLKINMPLQVDATFVYTHNKGSSQITMEELLDNTNKYNTYRHKGLPPGAIGSPGLSSLKATIYPIESDYLFYLADKDGKTYFSKTYEEHMAKRAQYINF